MKEDAPEGVQAAPNNDNILEWSAVIIGPEETPFEDGIFALVMNFTEEYPTKPPAVWLAGESGLGSCRRL